MVKLNSLQQLKARVFEPKKIELPIYHTVKVSHLISLALHNHKNQMKLNILTYKSMISKRFLLTVLHTYRIYLWSTNKKYSIRKSRNFSESLSIELPKNSDYHEISILLITFAGLFFFVWLALQYRSSD